MQFKKKITFLFLTFFLSLLLVGCQYQFGRGDLSERYRTISIPYAEGDQRGDLTSKVVKKLTSTGAFQYVNGGGDLTLKIKILEISDENIGFRYDRKKDGKLKRNIVPTETRLVAQVEVQLIESGSNSLLRGPTILTASVDFDHTYYTTRNRINVFSLGQLSDYDTAKEAAMNPLNRVLADRIVEYILNSW